MPRQNQRSEPHTHDRTTRTTASVACSTTGSGRSWISIAPGPQKIAARMALGLPCERTFAARPRAERVLGIGLNGCAFHAHMTALAYVNRKHPGYRGIANASQNRS